MRLKILILLLSFIACALHAAPVQYRLTKTESLLEIGVKVKLSKNARQIPPPAIQTREMTRGSNKIKVLAVPDAWRLRQVKALWSDPELGDAALYEVAYPVPADLKRVQKEFASVEVIDSWFAAEREPLDKAAALKSAELLMAATLAPETVALSRPNAFPQVDRLTFTAMASTGDAIPTVYLLGFKDGDGVRYFLLVYERPGGDAKNTAASLKETDKAALACTYQRPVRKSMAEKTGGNKNDAKRSPEYLRKRDEIVAQIANMKGWTYEELDHYLVMTNSKNRKMVKMVESELDRCRGIYLRYYPQGNVDGDVGRVKVFAERAEYLAYIPPEHAYSAGLFMGATGELVIAPAGDRPTKAAAESMMNTIYHEAWHHFLNQCGGWRAHSWFNEGNARVFEGIEFRGSRFTVRYSDDKFNRLKATVPNDVAALRKRIETIITYSQEKFYERDKIHENYDFSGFLIYFLINSPAFIPEKKYDQIAHRYFDAVTQRKEDPNAEVWKGVDMDAFCKDFLRFTTYKRWQTAAENYLPPEPAPDKK